MGEVEHLSLVRRRRGRGAPTLCSGEEGRGLTIYQGDSLGPLWKWLRGGACGFQKGFQVNFVENLDPNVDTSIQA